MGSKLTAEDLNLITCHLAQSFDGKIKSLEEILTNSVKGIQQVNEVNHESLYKEVRLLSVELSEVKGIALRGEAYGKLTNGRVTKLEGTIDGEKNSNNEMIRQGLAKDMKELRRYRFIYRYPITIIGIFLIMCSLFIKESRDYIVDIFVFIKNVI